MEPNYIRKLNRELEFERRGKKIIPTILFIFVFFTMIGPLILLVILNADWIDQAFSNLWVQVGFFTFVLSACIILYFKSKL
jgi:hypothetical protein